MTVMGTAPRTGLLIALPTGLTLGGVQSWAARLVSAWATFETPACILTHGATQPVMYRGGEALRAQWPLASELSEHAALLAGPELPALDGASEHDLQRMLRAYVAAIDGVLAACDRALLVPTLSGDCVGLCVGAVARLHATRPDLASRVRVAGWLHSNFPYDRAVLTHFAPALDCFACVSQHLTSTLTEDLPDHAQSIVRVPNAASVRAASAPRDLTDQSLRLLYVGRLEDDVKRVGVLPLLSNELARRGILHTLSIVGDGPARPALERAASDRVRVLGTRSQEQVRDLLATHDALLLPSRSEGLSLSMLEAMGQGCCPIVTRCDSGAGEAVHDGVTGLLIDCAHEPDPTLVARAFASVLEAAPRSLLHAMGERARRWCDGHYAAHIQLRALQQAIDLAFAAQPHVWNGPLSFSSLPSTGADGEARLRELLATLAPTDRVIVHGTGRHTRDLAHLWQSVLPRLVAFADDDASAQGELLGRPIVSPSRAKELGATHAIISSRLNEGDIWKRREMYERQGVRVLRIYACKQPSTPRNKQRD